MSSTNFQFMSQEHLDQFLKKLDELQRQVDSLDPDANRFVDNPKFLILMGISKRTAQSWRDSGQIAFSQIGGKIYYTMDDIQAFLERNKKHTF